jgi:outer membrane protein assembly factor BamD
LIEVRARNDRRPVGLPEAFHPSSRPGRMGLARGLAAAALGGALLLTGCASSSSKSSSSAPKKPDKLTQELLSTPKETLFEKGRGLIGRKKYEEGRKYLNFIFETYPNDPLGRESLLMVADSYFRQGGTAGYTEGRFRYRDYLNRYPGAARRDYARYQFALCYDKEHEKPDRDQTSTREAIDQYRSLIHEFPDSIYVSQAKERSRVLTDLLAEHEFGVGYFYMRKGSAGAALGRFTALEERFPEYRGRDKLFFYTARVLKQLGRGQEAERYLARILAEYPESEYAKKARGANGKPKAQASASASVDTRPKNE